MIIPPVDSSVHYENPPKMTSDERENTKDRRQRDRRSARSKALVATGQGDSPSSRTSAKPAASRAAHAAAFAAQLLGQPGRKRGLKAGQPTLDEARATYLTREYSGANERRPSPGIRKQTEI